MNYKYIGILDEKIAKQCGIVEHKNKPILVYDDKIEHVIEHHLKDFGSEEALMDAYNNISNIIKKPDYYYYNERTKGLEYYKNMNGDLCVAVRINPGKTLKVKSWYPANKGKISNRKKKMEEKLEKELEVV